LLFCDSQGNFIPTNSGIVKLPPLYPQELLDVLEDKVPLAAEISAALVACILADDAAFAELCDALLLPPITSTSFDAASCAGVAGVAPIVVGGVQAGWCWKGQKIETASGGGTPGNVTYVPIVGVGCPASYPLIWNGTSIAGPTQFAAALSSFYGCSVTLTSAGDAVNPCAACFPVGCTAPNNITVTAPPPVPCVGQLLGAGFIGFNNSVVTVPATASSFPVCSTSSNGTTTSNQYANFEVGPADCVGPATTVCINGSVTELAGSFASWIELRPGTAPAWGGTITPTSFSGTATNGSTVGGGAAFIVIGNGTFQAQYTVPGPGNYVVRMVTPNAAAQTNCLNTTTLTVGSC